MSKRTLIILICASALITLSSLYNIFDALQGELTFLDLIRFSLSLFIIIVEIPLIISFYRKYKNAALK